MSVWVKICGLTAPEHVAAAVAAGADAVGFVFAESPRRVSAERARELCADLPAGIATVAVMRHPSAADWDVVRDVFAPGYLQTDVADYANLQLGSVKALPVYREQDGDISSLPDGPFLFEGRNSGQGELADWGQAAALAERGELVLAGGLDPDNVAAAIAAVQPWGVDVSSGVEKQRGVKDNDKIAAFVQAARNAGQ